MDWRQDAAPTTLYHPLHWIASRRATLAVAKTVIARGCKPRGNLEKRKVLDVTAYYIL